MKKRINKSRYLWLLSIVAVSGFISLAIAEFSTAGWFCDNMVLQRDMPINIWGWAPVGTNVTVTLNGKGASGKSVAVPNIPGDGRWTVTLAAMKAGGPYTLEAKGGGTITIKNVMIGEVWVAAGQSNMQLDWFSDFADPAGAPTETINNFRLYNIQNMSKNPVLDVKRTSTWPPPGDSHCGADTWKIADAKHSKAFSQVGYWFGKKLHDDLNVPVGVIMVARGSTSIEEWQSKLGQNEAKGVNINFGKYSAEPVAKFASSGEKDLYHQYNGRIHPLMGLSIGGCIWWQGETDALWKRRNRDTYGAQFKSMINEYRHGPATLQRNDLPADFKAAHVNYKTSWGIGDFPFIFIQLQNCGVADAQIQQEQLKALELPNVAMVKSDGVSGIHPAQEHRRPLGEKMAEAAIKMIGGDWVGFKPQYQIRRPAQMTVSPISASLRMFSLNGRAIGNAQKQSMPNGMYLLPAASRNNKAGWVTK